MMLLLGTLDLKTGEGYVNGVKQPNTISLDDGIHTLKVYYLERGSGESNFKLRFKLNFPDTEVSGSKIWEDYNNKYNTRPEKITVNLLQNGKVIESKEVTAEDNWSYQFTKLLKCDSNGNIYEYAITEDKVEGYETIIEGFDIINSLTDSLTITKVAEEDDSKTLEGAEFALYKYIGSNSSIWDSQLIDTSNVDSSEWELVGTKTTGEDGKFTFEDLQIIREYRLIETKAPEGRLLPTGQWKVEFMRGDYDENDSGLVKIDDKVLKITAIGNPPALKLSQTFMQKVSTSLLNTTGGELLLPNRSVYELPSSGGTINNTIRYIGLISALLGVIIIMRKSAITVRRNIRTSNARKCTARARRRTARVDSTRKSAERKTHHSTERNTSTEESKNTTVNEDVFKNFEINKYNLTNMQNRILIETKYKDNMLKNFKDRWDKK